MDWAVEEGTGPAQLCLIKSLSMRPNAGQLVSIKSLDRAESGVHRMGRRVLELEEGRQTPREEARFEISIKAVFALDLYKLEVVGFLLMAEPECQGKLR